MCCLWTWHSPVSGWQVEPPLQLHGIQIPSGISSMTIAFWFFLRVHPGAQSSHDKPLYPGGQLHFSTLVAISSALVFTLYPTFRKIMDDSQNVFWNFYYIYIYHCIIFSEIFIQMKRKITRKTFTNFSYRHY